MSEIEKMYDNANVKKQIPDVCSSNELYCKGCIAYIENAIPYCKNAEYPPFTAEKQLELIKFYIKSVWWLNLACFKSSSLPFDEELAKLTNHLWEDMTISQREQIRSILNG